MACGHAEDQADLRLPPPQLEEGRQDGVSEIPTMSSTTFSEPQTPEFQG